MAMGMWQGLANSTKQIPSMGMGLLQMRQQQEQNEAQMQIQRDRLQMAQVEANRAAEDARKRQEAYDRPLDIKTHPMFLSLPEEAQGKAMKFFSSNKFTNEAGIGKSGDIISGVKMLEGSKQIFSDIMGEVVKAKSGTVMEAWNAYKEASAKPDADPEKIAKLKAVFDKENAAYQASVGGFSKHIQELDKRDAAEKLAMTKGNPLTEAQISTLPPDDPRRINAISYKRETQKPTTVTPQLKTIYGPNGATKEVSITPGTEYVPPKDWSLTKPEKPAKVNNVVLTNTATKERRTVDKNSDEYINLTEAGWEVAKPPRQMPANDINGLQGFTDLRSIAESLKGIGTKYAGPITGRARLLSAKFFDDPDFVSAKSKLGKLMPVIYSLSGKQINEWEKKWLKEDIIPNLTSPGANFEATLQSFIEWIDMKDKNLRTSYEEGGYIVPPPGKAKMEGTKKKPLSQY